jgi:hypothetical protein
MQEQEEEDRTRWEQVTNNLDLLFEKVNRISTHQQKLETKFDMTTTVLEQVLKVQQLLSQQIEVTGQVVAKLTVDQMEHRPEPPNPTSSVDSVENPFYQYGSHGGTNVQGTKVGRPPKWKEKEEKSKDK